MTPCFRRAVRDMSVTVRHVFTAMVGWRTRRTRSMRRRSRESWRVLALSPPIRAGRVCAVRLSGVMLEGPSGALGHNVQDGITRCLSEKLVYKVLYIVTDGDLCHVPAPGPGPPTATPQSTLHAFDVFPAPDLSEVHAMFLRHSSRLPRRHSETASASTRYHVALAPRHADPRPRHARPGHPHAGGGRCGDAAAAAAAHQGAPRPTRAPATHTPRAPHAAQNMDLRVYELTRLVSLACC